MMNQSRNVPILAVAMTVVMVLFGHSSVALNLKSAHEQPCFEIKNTVPLDMEWASSVKTWYYPLMSRYDLYHAALDLTRESFQTTPESSLYYDSCMIWKLHENGSFMSQGFGDLSRAYETKLLSPNMELFEFAPKEGTGYRGIGYSTFTDNKTFSMLSYCSSDGQMSWSLGTVKPKLTMDLNEKVMRRAEELGFDKEYFTELKYDHCDLEVDNEISESDE